MQHSVLYYENPITNLTELQPTIATKIIIELHKHILNSMDRPQIIRLG